MSSKKHPVAEHYDRHGVLADIDEAQIIALRKIATLKSIPYQTLIRSWLAQDIQAELKPRLRRAG